MLKLTHLPTHNLVDRLSITLLALSPRARNSSGGFTMIELMVSISIMILLVGGGIASFITFNDKQQLQGSTKMVQTYLRTAQTKARVGDRPEECSRLDGYEVQVPQGSTTLSLVAICEGDGTEVPVQSTTLEKVESISFEGGELSILFKVLHGGTEDEGTVTITSTNGATEQFNVSAGGEITELGYVRNTSNPAGSGAASPSSMVSPSPTPSNQVSSSPSVSPSPSPTPSPSTGIFLNQASNLTCNQICVQKGFARCTSIGTDKAATNKMQMSMNMNNGQCVESEVRCGSAIERKSGTCFRLRTTADANWTYCKCTN
jgi:type II secretory pathway pseudopilin PulG